MEKAKTRLSTVAEEFRELDLMFKSGSDLGAVESGYARKLILAISCSNEVLECEALKGLGDLYLQKAKTKGQRVENFKKACALYTNALRYSPCKEEKEVIQHRVKYAEKCTKLIYKEECARFETSASARLAVSMTLHEVKQKTTKGRYGVVSLVERYTDCFLRAIVDRNELLGRESLKSLGDLYLENGRVGRDYTAFTKAFGLYRAALDRCEDSDGRETLNHRIRMDTRLANTGDKRNEDTDSVYEESLQKGCRALQAGDLDRAEQNFAAALKSIHVQGHGTGNPVLRSGICHLDERNRNNVTYFRNLTHYLHLKVINLGETILPAMAIKSLNDFHSADPLDDWFYDNVTPRGFSLDGAMPHAYLGDCREAVSYYEQALQMNLDIYGEGTAHPDIAQSLNNLGGSWTNLGDHRKAIRCYEQSLHMMQCFCGGNTANPDIAGVLNNLGTAWGDLGNYRKAVSYQEQSLQMKRGIYGEGTAHPDIAGTLNNLGGACTYLGDHRQAINYFEQSLRIMRIIYGESTVHPDIAGALNNLGYGWMDLGEYRKAMNYFKQALQMSLSIYGEDNAHPDIAQSFNNMGAAWSELGDYRKAIDYFDKSLQVKRSTYGKTTPHPSIALSLNNLGGAWRKNGDKRKAIGYYEQSLKMKRSIYGTSTAHPDIAHSFNSLGTAWGDLGNHKKSIRYHELSLQMKWGIYGDNAAHPHIATSLNNLANAWSNLGNHKKAVSYYEWSLQMMWRIYGKSSAHPDIAALLNNLGICWMTLGDHRTAYSYYKKLQQMMTSIYG
uniref:Uncharacterized protein n=1 Tax=Branchiostoma floridae TaxID=7739 RepID=C3YX98_BRAFL|eukprot:XP_002599104.1 hypothetical protein BRAFLDRAFT_81770 [Branchiostoma floridae]